MAATSLKDYRHNLTAEVFDEDGDPVWLPPARFEHLDPDEWKTFVRSRMTEEFKVRLYLKLCYETLDSFI